MSTFRATLPDLRARVVVALMWDVCARCCEVSRLNVEDYDPTARTVFLRGKNDHERIVPASPETCRLLDAYLAETGAKHGSIIRNKERPYEGLTAATLSHYVREWLRAAGVKRGALDGKSAHGLRRTGGSEIMEACGDVRTVQAVLGHARIETTARYYLRAVTMDRMRDAQELRHDVPDAA